MDTQTVGDVSIEQLEELLDGDSELCTYESCQTPAEWWVICHIDGEREPMCSRHKQEISNWPSRRTLYFDQSCEHVVYIGDLIWEPLG